MLTLYWARETGALAPQILLEELDLDYERVILELDQQDQKTSEFLAINPRGQVPALCLQDGSILTESAAMMMHLADQSIETGLIPLPATPERAQVYRWMTFAVANIYDADLRIFYSDSYTTDATGVDAIRTQARIDLDNAWDIVEAALQEGPYFLGERYSILDPYLLMLAYWHEHPTELFSRCSKLERLCNTVLDRPAVQSIWHQHYPDA
jgi:glutathione S-transferase/GST-like protein